MAKYVPSAMIGQLSGSTGSTTFGRNRNGSYFRGRSTPVNPRTDLQGAQRVSQQDLADNWRALTSAQRSAWNVLGPQIQRTDSLGQVYTLTGFQAYVAANRELLFIGQPTISTAPPLAPPPGLTSLSLSALNTPADLVEVTFGAAILAANSLVLQATPVVSRGTNFGSIQKLYRTIAILTSVDTSPYDATTDWEAIFGDLPAGNVGRVYVRARAVSNSNGQTSAWRQAVTSKLA